MRAQCGGGASSAPPPLPADQILDNVLENVLQFLTSRSDRNSASLVCWSWYRAEARTRSDLFIGNCYSVSPSRALRRFPRAHFLTLKGRPRFADFDLLPSHWGAYLHPWLSSLSLSHPFLQRLHLKRISLSDSDLHLLSLSFPSFRDLVLASCEGFGSTGLASLARHCSHLRVLDLIECEVDDDDVDWIASIPDRTTSLESLVIDCLPFEINLDALERLVARCPNLRRLRVGPTVDVPGLCRLMKLAPRLTHLGTGSFHPAPTQDGNAGEAEQLQELASTFASCPSLVCLSGFRRAEPRCLPAILHVCSGLTSLNLSYAVVTGEQLRPVVSRCRNLQNLWVLDSVRDEGLCAVASSCKDLRKLRVFPIAPDEDTESPVSDVGLTAISEGCRKLSSILYFCQHMTNASVITMSKNCPYLEVFRLCIMGRSRPDYRTGESMDEGFGAIVMNCKKLTRLAVSGLLTDKVFEYVGKYGKLLRTLSVAFAGNSELGLRYVLEGCSNMQKLEIRDCPFGDLGLLSGLHHFYNMRFLWMSSCKLTLRGCREVARRLPHLVVEVVKGPEHRENGKEDHCENGKEEDDENNVPVDILYLYRSLAGPRTDAPPTVEIL